jgi:Flp pilus assembly protein TadG
MKAMAAWDVARGNDIVVLMRGRRQRRPEEQPKRGRGQALVEFALVVPIMILIFGALVQFAFIFERQIGIENAVRDGARRAATYETVDATDAAVNGPFTWNLVFGSGGLMLTNVQGYVSSTPPVHDPKVCYTNQTAANGVSSVLVKVSVGYSHPLFLPLISQLIDPLDGVIDGALRVDTSSEFVIENDPTIPTSVVGSPLCFT